MTSIIYPDLAGKTVLVTGANRGIGRGICRALAQNKATIVYNYRTDSPQIEQQVLELKELGATEVYLAKFDIAYPEQIKAGIDQAIKDAGEIQGLINNAGVAKDQLLLRVKPEDVDHTIDINLKGAINVSQALSKNFLRAENVSIINISSIVGLMGNVAQSVYAASKSGLIGFTKSMAKEMGKKQVRCNAICPGFIQTDMTAEISEQATEHYKASIPLGRMGDADEVANLACFLLSNASSYITGETIKIDGGLYI